VSLPTAQERLADMSAQLFLAPGDLGDLRMLNKAENRRYFTRRPDALLFDEQPEVSKVLKAMRSNSESQPARPLGDIEFCEVESSKKDAVTQAKSFNGLFYLGFLMDGTFERGLVTKVMLVTRNHPHADLRAKLLTAYELWLARKDVQSMLRKKANLTPGFHVEGLSERLWLAELTQDSERRLTGMRMESVASIFLRERRVEF
jgi:hypothetical protein